MEASQLTALLQTLLSAVANGEFNVTVGDLLSEANLGGVSFETDALPGFRRVRTFEEAGVLSSNSGLVVDTDDGESFQVTVVS